MEALAIFGLVVLVMWGLMWHDLPDNRDYEL